MHVFVCARCNVQIPHLLNVALLRVVNVFVHFSLVDV